MVPFLVERYADRSRSMEGLHQAATKSTSNSAPNTGMNNRFIWLPSNIFLGARQCLAVPRCDFSPFLESPGLVFGISLQIYRHPTSSYVIESSSPERNNSHLVLPGPDNQGNSRVFMNLMSPFLWHELCALLLSVFLSEFYSLFSSLNNLGSLNKKIAVLF